MNNNFNWIELASASATSGAVVVAMCAIRSENKHRNAERRRAEKLRQHDLEEANRERVRAEALRREDQDAANRDRARADQIRKDDLDAAVRREEAEAQRSSQERSSRARRLAKIFDRELTEAAAQLNTLGKLLEDATPETIPQFVQIYARPLGPKVFKMHERFLDQLDVFPDMLAISIVNNMTNWSSIPLFSDGLAQSPGIDMLRIRHKVLADIESRVELFGETKSELVKYFADLPGLRMFTFEEIRGMNEANAEVRRRRKDAGKPGNTAG
ncbi:hypothetical protein H9654_00490 [Stenotrophomonas sp. Sa5BUN4]|uniref:Uncharacterized protein n=1 Tax=Stenotrophomonas lacuserhaii TaxID=2760084 RepID=A0A8X8FXB7_9GAMM|nr:hypothetical protein [Stenotrophomonas pennii]MBD7952670.1 hypothetical protein [Stenotrophomonas pennii]